MEKSNLKILLAEDNPISQEMIKFILERHGLECTVVEDGEQVIKLLEKECFDVILMDMQMPVMDGCDAARIIRESEKTTGRHIRIIALTASNAGEDRQLCIDAGMDDYLTKPADPDLLIAMIRSETRIAAQSAAKPAPGDSRAPVALDNEALQQRVLGAALPSASMAKLFLKELPETLAGIDYGIQQHQYAELARFAHRMAGAAAIIGAGQLALIAQELESTVKAGSVDKLENLNAELRAAAEQLQQVLQAFLDRQH